MNFKFMVAVLTAVFSMCFVACSSDDDNKDVRDQAVGNYSMTMTSYIEKDGVLELVETSDEGICTVVKKGSASLVIDDDLVASKIAEASNGFTFDIESQVVDGKTMTGYNGCQLVDKDGSVKYHGMYLSAKNELTFYVQFSLDDLAEDFVGELSEEEIARMQAFLDVLDIETFMELDELTEGYSVVIETVLKKK